MQCFRYNVQQRTATELPSRLYVAVWQMRFFQHRLHDIINLFGSKLCVLAVFIHTKESKLQKGKHKCIFVYTLQMLVACHCEWKKRKERKTKTNAIAKRKMYGIEITIQWAKYTAFRQKFHVSSTSVTCSPYGYGTCMLWLNREKEIENGELYFLFRRFVFATLWHRLTVYSSLSKQTNETQTLCEIVEDARSV